MGVCVKKYIFWEVLSDSLVSVSVVLHNSHGYLLSHALGNAEEVADQTYYLIPSA